jgi:hypothetical protein
MWKMGMNYLSVLLAFLYVVFNVVHMEARIVSEICSVISPY